MNQSRALFLPPASEHLTDTRQVELIVCFFFLSVFMLYVAWKRRLPRKFARFLLFRPIKKRSYNLLCVFGSFFRTLAVNSVSDFFASQITKHGWFAMNYSSVMTKRNLCSLHLEGFTTILLSLDLWRSIVWIFPFLHLLAGSVPVSISPCFSNSISSAFAEWNTWSSAESILFSEALSFFFFSFFFPRIDWLCDLISCC